MWHTRDNHRLKTARRATYLPDFSLTGFLWLTLWAVPSAAQAQEPQGDGTTALLSHRRVEQVLATMDLSTPLFNVAVLFLVVAGLVGILVVLMGLRSGSTRLVGFFTGEMPSFRRWVVVLLTLYLGAITAVTWSSLEMLETRTRKDAGHALVTITDSISESLRLWHSGVRRDLRRLGSSLEPAMITEPSPRLRLSERQASDLQGWLNELQAQEALLLDHRGQAVFSLSGLATDMDAVSPDNLKRLQSGQGVLRSLSGNPRDRQLWLGQTLEVPAGNPALTAVVIFDVDTVVTSLMRAAQLQDSGETYALSDDGRMLSLSRFQGDRRRGEILRRPQTPGNPDDPGQELPRSVRGLMQQDSGIDLEGYRDYRGVPVLGAWLWIEPLQLGLVSEIDVAEVLSPVYRIRWLALALVGGLLVVALLLPLILLRLGQRSSERLQKRVDEQTVDLRTSEQVVLQSPLAIMVTDASGVIQRVNPRFLELSGYSEAEAIGNNPRMLKSGLNSPDTYDELWRTILAGKRWTGELQNRSKNGRLYWVSAYIAPVLDEAGRVQHFVSMSEDITERKHIEDRARRAAWVRDMAVHAGELGLWSFNPVTGDWYFDDRCKSLMGDSDNRLERVHEDDRPALDAEARRMRQVDGDVDIEFRLYAADGSLRHLWVRGKPEEALPGGAQPHRGRGQRHHVAARSPGGSRARSGIQSTAPEFSGRGHHRHQSPGPYPLLQRSSGAAAGLQPRGITWQAPA